MDTNGEQWSPFELALAAVNTDHNLADVEEGTYVVPTDRFRMLCTDGSTQSFAKLEIDFRSRLRFYRRSALFDTGVAILDTGVHYPLHRHLDEPESCPSDTPSRTTTRGDGETTERWMAHGYFERTLARR